MELNIYDFTPDSLAEYLGDVPKFRAKQIYKWIFSGKTPDEMTNVPKDLREKLKNDFYTELPKIDIKLVSKLDGTVKYLFRMEDDAGIESVVMPYHHGRTICVSSQAGCRMGCAFCASTIDGLDRNLTSGEIIGQILAAERDLGEKISHVVIMGSGEPLDNYENALDFIRNAVNPEGLGLSARHIPFPLAVLLIKCEGFRRRIWQLILPYLSMHRMMISEKNLCLSQRVCLWIPFFRKAESILIKPTDVLRLNMHSSAM